MDPQEIQRRIDLGLPLTLKQLEDRRRNLRRLALTLIALYLTGFILLLKFVCD